MSLTSPALLSPQEKKELAIQYAGLVKHIASRMSVLLPYHVELDDLVNDGVVGLMEALNRFDPGRGIKFQTFAANRIRGAILDSLRKQDWVSRRCRRRGRELTVAEESLSQSLGHLPSTAELSNHTGLSCDDIRKSRKETECGYISSLDEARTSQDGSEDRLQDRLADPTVDVEAQVLQKAKREALLESLKRLSEREQLILSLYYFEELNIAEIGRILGVSEARISQLHSRCIRKLRDAIGQRDLEQVS